VQSNARADAVHSHEPDIKNFIHIKVNYLPTPALVDTGCFCSCISPDLVRKLKLRVQSLDANEYSLLFSANSSRIRLIGKVEVSLNFAGLIVPYTLLVLDNLIHDVMLGMNILTELQANIDLSAGRVSFHDNLVTLPITKWHHSTVTLSCVKSTTLPPYSETLIPVQYKEAFSAKIALIEPTPNLNRRQILGARMAVTPTNKRTFCRLLNPGSTPKRIRKNEPIAFMSPILIPGHTPSRAGQQTIDTIGPPKSLADMERTLSQLDIKLEKTQLTSQQYTDLCTLVFQNRDLFATQMSQLPGTSLVAHHIDTGDARPIRSRPYRHSVEAKKRNCTTD